MNFKKGDVVIAIRDWNISNFSGKGQIGIVDSVLNDGVYLSVKRHPNHPWKQCGMNSILVFNQDWQLFDEKKGVEMSFKEGDVVVAIRDTQSYGCRPIKKNQIAIVINVHPVLVQQIVIARYLDYSWDISIPRVMVDPGNWELYKETPPIGCANTDNEICNGCGRPTVPLMGPKRYCPKCER